MNLKLKRLVRTQSSEQYALFDLNQLDEQDAPMTIGKLDLHYTGEGVYGTLLLWDELSRRLHAGRRSAFVRALLDEIAQPMGVPNEYVVEFFAPGLDEYEVIHNVTIDDEGGTDELFDEMLDDDFQDSELDDELDNELGDELGDELEESGVDRRRHDVRQADTAGQGGEDLIAEDDEVGAAGELG